MSLRVLLIMQEFYGIEKKIKSVLEELGYEVTWLENKTLPFDYHSTKSKFRILRRIYFFLFFPQMRYIKKHFTKIENTSFDILFSINCNIICSYLFRILKKENPRLFSVIYLWDSSKMYSWENEIKLFDKVFTFDYADSISLRLEYKPNFFLKSEKNSQKNLYDIFFVGKFTPLRYGVIEKLLSNIRESSVSFYIWLVPSYKNLLHNKLLYKILKNITSENKWIRDYVINYEANEGLISRDYISIDPIRFEDVHVALTRSNVILDIPFSEQKGFSHRLVQALALGKKVLTISGDIMNESFYNPAQIKILDPDNLYFEKDWVCEQVHFPLYKEFKDNELSIWLKSMINVEGAKV